MQTTGTSRGDGAVAMGVALAVNALLAWQLKTLLAPPPGAVVDDAAPALQVVWIVAAARRTARMAPPRLRNTTAHPSPRPDRPPPLHAKPDVATTEANETSADPTPARPMTAVYLQQAGQWAQRQEAVRSAGNDAFAARVARLPGQAPSRFRIPDPVSVADVVDAIGQAFGNGPHPCVRNPDDVAGYATGGDALALQMALDVDRQCRP